jgi:CheY-like chemotaxis protein
MAASEPVRVLVLVDHALDRHIFERLLVDAGCEVDLAEGESDAIRRATCRRPDVVVLDLVIDGDAWQRIKTACGPIPLVVAGRFTSAAHAHGMRASAYVEKKNYAGIVDAVRTAISARDSKDTAAQQMPYVPHAGNPELLRRAIHDARQQIRDAGKRDLGSA